MGDQDETLSAAWSAPFLYNPAFLPAAALKRLFLARHVELDALLRTIRATTRTVPHTLIIGDPGMGKTTLLMRVALAVEEDPTLNKVWQPVRFSEEPYDLSDLADLWMRVLGILVDEGSDRELIGAVEQLKEDHKDSREQLEQAAFAALKRHAISSKRRLLLLIDNFEFILRRLAARERSKPDRGQRTDNKDRKHALWRLREQLSHEDWFMLLAANPEPIQQTIEYDEPLYEFFDVITLNSIELADAQQLFAELAMLGHVEDVIARRPETLLAIHPLIAGNLRALVTLFNFLRSNPDAELRLLVNYLLDQHTRFFKDQIDNLPDQAQRVFDGLAKFQNPTDADEIADQIGIERGVASAQLHRLVQRNLVLKRDLPGRKLGFMVRDRFLNTWCLMRSGGRWRQRLEDLVDFLSLFFHPTRAEDSRTRRIWNLLQNLKVATSLELSSMLGPPVAGQEELFGKSKEAAVLRSYHQRDLVQAKRLAEDFLGNTSLLVRIVYARTLEELGEYQAAWEVVEDIVRSNPSFPDTQQVWLDLERIRLLGRLERNIDATTLLAALLHRRNLPAADLALELSEISRLDDHHLASISGLLLEEAEKRIDRDLSFLIIRCNMAWEAGNASLAVAKLTRALCAFDAEAPKSARAATLALALRFAASEANLVGEALRESGFHQKWLPASLALDVLTTGEPERLLVLAPEIASITHMVLDRIDSPADPRQGQRKARW